MSSRSVPDVAEVASVGGLVKQYQIVLDPDRMRGARHHDRQSQIGVCAIRTTKPAGRCWSWEKLNTPCAPTGYLKNLDDFRSVPVGPGGRWARRYCWAM